MFDYTKVVDCINAARVDGNLVEREDVLTGYSGKMLYGTLQRLSRELLDENTCYLEIGVFQGLTLLSAALAAPQSAFYGVDNFAFFDPDNKNKSLVEERINTLNLKNCNLINADYEDVLENLDKHLDGKKIGVYFIDGPHDYRSQLMCLALVKPHLADNAVILVDDSNYRHVRQANRDFLYTHPEFKLIFESYTKAHPMNLKGEDLKDSRNGWWDGINIIVKDPDNHLEPFYPETLRDRGIYENEHLLHSSRYPEHQLLLWEISKKLRLHHLLNLVRSPKKMYTGKFKNSNTYSGHLSQKGRFNPSFEAK